tara:strand:- start:133 stop:1785 length:1653 start_codon:yes stop_codon:yes gene_type:complete
MNKISIKDQENTTKFRCIDLYSGMGGWGLGFKMADINIVSSYEMWEPAASTQNLNLGGTVNQVDIRNLKLSELPKNINLVVGSPPCTQFSLANRGGKGNISEGMKDIYKFLEIVEFISPSFWIMENVPRVAKILEKAVSSGGELQRFREIIDDIHIVDCSDYGLPQRRKRMLAGSFPFQNLEKFSKNSERKNLKDVISSLSGNKIIDPNYAFSIDKKDLYDHDFEDYLSPEEFRLNKESKTYHRVYNLMTFPEPYEKPSRTIAATESRVVRESLIINDDSGYRRLSNRERATLQGFPITYQFNANSYSARQKMIGNAIPPLLTYYIGCAINNWDEKKSKKVKELFEHKLPKEIPPKSTKRGSKNSYSKKRRFRSAIPNLRFGSGVRFELANIFQKKSNKVCWEVSFYYGKPKDYKKVTPAKNIKKFLLDYLETNPNSIPKDSCKNIEDQFLKFTSADMQNRWNHSVKTGKSPFELCDLMGDLFKKISSSSNSLPNIADWKSFTKKLGKMTEFSEDYFSWKKHQEYNKDVILGILIASLYNSTTTFEKIIL